MFDNFLNRKKLALFLDSDLVKFSLHIAVFELILQEQTRPARNEDSAEVKRSRP